MTTAPYREVEIKLVGTSKTLDAAFADLGEAASKSSRVTSIYLDTIDKKLWHQGLTLRLRAKEDRHELTMKRETGALARGEWSAMVDTPVANIGLLPLGVPREEIGVILPEELGERHRTVATRRKKVVVIDGATFEVSLDRGQIRAGRQSIPLEELEIELLHGPDDAVAAVARNLIMRRSLRVAFESKAARGMALSAGKAPKARKFRRPALTDQDTLGTAFQTIVAATAQQVAGNLAAVQDGTGPKGVHQMRVGLRRLRSTLSLFKGHLNPKAAALRDDARMTLQALGPARDLDVFLTQMLPPVLAAHTDTASLHHLRAIAEKEQRAAYLALRRLLKARAFNRLLLDLLGAQDMRDLLVEDSRDKPLPKVAAKLLGKRHRKVIAAGQGFAEIPLDQRHEVRIAAKKLRYAIDFLGGLYPEGPMRLYRRDMSRLQDDLGHLNDAAVASELVDRLAGDDAKARVGAALVKGWYAHRLAAIEPEMVAAWDAFAETPIFWKGHGKPSKSRSDE
ncbi:MAG: CHAD domain-containing protein [Minwuia sp.]|nr:CHAD domain-containing protein [Minwuia sp.]